ncbi:RICIN domain-containing protein [Amycolatopsis sp. NPDC058278]|uniref:RICIN domain-containing protein n=1 Tax=Amycolatopsis sp. NPDC058278 TaxID=3346417 RepID=UPI0036DC1935
MKHRVLTAAFLSMATTAAIAVTGVPAAFAASGKDSPAVVADAVNTFKNQATGRCIDDSSAGFRTWTCNTSTNQKWNVHIWGDGTRQLKNQATGRCIDDSSAGFRTWTCWPGSDPNSANQSW